MNLSRSAWRKIFIIGLGFLLLFFLLFPPSCSVSRSEAVSVEEFVHLVRKGAIPKSTVILEKTSYGIVEMKGVRQDPRILLTVQPNVDADSEIYKEIINERLYGKLGVKGGNKLIGSIVSFLPMLFFGGLILFAMIRGQKNLNNFTQSMGRSRTKGAGEQPRVTFNDVAGVDEAKQELQEVVEFLKFPERFSSLGAKIPKGVLLVGYPGTGKTLLARAVAGEAGVPFFHMSGSEFVELFVGVGASRVRNLFDQAKSNSPCIVFIDEIDAVGRHRGAGLGSGHDEREQTLNQILVEMDGFETNTRIIVLAATNRPDILDPALLRPGRFDRRVTLDLPDVSGRLAILRVHSLGKPIDPDLHLEEIARQTPGFSGADLANVVNEAAIMAARSQKKTIGKPDFEEAVERVIAGPERKSRLMSEKDKKIIAWHEAGHAVVAWRMKHADPLHKISIVARGMSGGHTRMLPEEDRMLASKDYFLDQICVLLGGRVSEALFCKEITTGAHDDLSKATILARKMITQYGMSERLGSRTFGQKQALVFLGREISEHQDYSDQTAREIDEEVQSLINQAEMRAKEVLESEKDRIERLVAALFEYETLDSEKLLQILPLETNIEPV